MDVLTFPFRLVWGFVIFMIFAWTTSRSGRAFILAIPAMLFAVLYLAMVWVVGFKGENKAVGLTAGRLSKAENPAEPAYNPEASVLYSRKLVDLQPEEPLWKFKLASAYAVTGEMDRAIEIMKWLAPEDSEEQPGYAKAHLWLAGYYRNPENGNLDDLARKQVSERYIRNAYNASSEDEPFDHVRAILASAGIERETALDFREKAEQLRAENRDEEAKELEIKAEAANRRAVELLEKAFDLPLNNAGQLSAGTEIIAILQEQGKDAEAVMEGRKFINSYASKAQRFPDVAPLWINLVRACILIEDYELGKKFASSGYQATNNDEVKRAMANLSAEILVAESMSYEDMDDKQQFVQRLYALSEAIQTNFATRLAYQEIAYFIDGFDADSEQDIWLRDSVLGIESDDSSTWAGTPGIIHIVLGLRDILNGNTVEGRRHWEIANVQLPQTPLIINLLLQVYSRQRELDFDKKIELIDIAIKQFPQSGFFHVTRGSVLQEAGRHDEAIKDLEFALARIPENRNILELLVKSLEATSATENLAEYRQRIADIKAKEQARDQLAGFYSARQRELEEKEDSDEQE